jgi:hypothetical protein
MITTYLEKPWQVGLLSQHSDTSHVELEQRIPAGESFKCCADPHLEKPWHVGFELQHICVVQMAAEHVIDAGDDFARCVLGQE